MPLQYFAHMQTAISAIHTQIGMNVQAFRKKHAFTLDAFGKLCQIKVDHLKQIEKGTVNMRLSTLIKLLSVMELSLFEGMDEKYPGS